MKKAQRQENWKKFTTQYVDKELIAPRSPKKVHFSPNSETRPSSQKGDKKEISLLFTYSDGFEEYSLYQGILAIINEAIESDSFLYISSFYINSFVIINKIEEAARELRGKVFIMLDKQSFLHFSYSKEGDIKEKGIIDLLRLGVNIRKKRNAHLKFILNSSKAILTTANLSNEALLLNPEYGISYKSNTDQYHSLKVIFSYLWHECAELTLCNGQWQKAPHWKVNSINSYTFKKKYREILLNNEKILQKINSSTKIVRHYTVFDSIIQGIKRAKNEILISVYNIFDTKYTKPIINELKEKARAGIKIQLILPDVNVKLRNDIRKTLKTLKSTGIDIKYYKEIHGKVIIIDKVEALIFTGNIDNYLSRKISIDLGGIITQKHNVKLMHNFFTFLWKNAECEVGKSSPISLDLFLSINSRSQISKQNKIPIKELSHRIQNAKSIEWLIHPEKSRLIINGHYTSLYLEHQEEIKQMDERIEVVAKIKDNIHFRSSTAESFLIKSLNLTLVWRE